MDDAQQISPVMKRFNGVDGIKAVYLFSGDQRIDSIDLNDRWSWIMGAILVAASHGLENETKMGRAIFGDYTIVSENDDDNMFLVVIDTGHCVAKSIRRMMKRALAVYRKEARNVGQLSLAKPATVEMAIVKMPAPEIPPAANTPDV